VHADEAALSHIINSLLWPSVENELSRESLCDGKSSIKRAATMLAPEGDQRSLSDFQIVEARLVEARFISRAKRSRENLQGPPRHCRHAGNVIPCSHRVATISA
jgi:hypothetical protein